MIELDFENPNIVQIKNFVLSKKRACGQLTQLLNNKFKLTNLAKFVDTFYGETVSQKLYSIAFEIVQPPSCICGKPLSFKCFSQGYASYCGSKCSSNDTAIKNKTNNTRLQKYGTATLKDLNPQKRAAVIKERFGVEHPMMAKQVSEKRSLTLTERYGGVGFGSLAINAKIEQTMIERFGVPRNWKSPELVEQYREERLEKTISRYKSIFSNFEISLSDGEYLGNYKFVSMRCKTCDTTIFKNFMYGGPVCPKCSGLQNKSMPENEIYDFCKNLLPSDEVFSSYRPFPNPDQRSLDIYIPHLKLAFEFNGLYWHSSNFKDPEYHQRKSEDAKNLGIRVIHIFEDDYNSNPEIVKSMISNALGLSKKVYARKCSIRTITAKLAREFLDHNHLQGFIAGKHYIGLFENQDLISVMVISKTRFSNNYKWELGRWATKLGFVCVGGFSKVLKEAKRLVDGAILTYCDASHSDGKTYEKFGTLLYKTQPNYFYFCKKEWWRHNRIQFQKHKLKNLPNFSNEKTEKEIMLERGWMIIYDCGNLVFEL